MTQKPKPLTIKAKSIKVKIMNIGRQNNMFTIEE